MYIARCLHDEEEGEGEGGERERWEWEWEQERVTGEDVWEHETSGVFPDDLAELSPFSCNRSKETDISVSRMLRAREAWWHSAAE